MSQLLIGLEVRQVGDGSVVLDPVPNLEEEPLSPEAEHGDGGACVLGCQGPVEHLNLVL